MEDNNKDHQSKEALRIEFFSDGVFAIAITLLVLELIQTLHSQPGTGILEIFKHHWESFVAFIIGFITILVCWINHHVAFEYIKRANTTFMWINGFLLFVVTLTPFPTAILAEYLEKDSKTALAIFGFNYILISIAADAICSYAYNHSLIDEKDREFYYSFKLIYRYAIFFTIAAFLFCFLSIVIPVILYTLLFILFAAPKELSARLYKMRRPRSRPGRVQNVESSLTAQEEQKLTISSNHRFTIRKVVPGDVAGLARLHVATYKETHGSLNAPNFETRESQWRKLFLDKDSWFCFVIEKEDGSLVGFAKGQPYRHPDHPGFAGELNKIYLLNQYHQLGLGRQLICKVANEFINRDIHSMLLFGDAKNLSNGFYESMGAEKLFAKNGEFHGGYGWKDLKSLVSQCRNQ